MFGRRSVAVLALFLAPLVITACSSSSDNNKSSGGAQTGGAHFQTATPGVLTIATEVGNPGWVNGTDPEHITGGVEYEMALEMAKEFGIPKVVFRNVSFTPLISGTVTGYDIGLMTIFKTPAREQVNTYSDCYYPAITGALVRNGVRLGSAADAKNLRWGYVTGGYAGLIMQKLNPSKPAKSFPDGPTEYAALASGSIDAVMDDLSSLAGRSQQKGFENTHVAAVMQGNGVPVPCSAAQLPKNGPAGNVNAVNTAIAKMKAAGQIDGWVHQYLSALGSDPSKYPTIVVG
jgi:polar amino acid transport system substrate-binding protein